MSTVDSPSLREIETHGIDFIPEDERRSSPLNIFWIFIGSNLTFGLIVIGWLPVSFGLSWWASFWSIIVGDAIGALMVAPIALIGPRSGTNGPVSSGAVFGVVGRIIGSALALFTAVGFYALAVWTGGQIAVFGAHKLFGLPGNNVSLGVAYGIGAIFAIVAAVYGHAHLVLVEKVLIPTAGLVVVIGFFVYSSHFDAGYRGGQLALGSFTPTWVLAVTIAAATTYGYALFVNDWTRHISRTRWPDRSVVGAAGLGAFFGLTLPLVFGAFTAVAIRSSAVPYVDGLVGITPTAFLIPVIIVGIIGSLGQSTVCIYGNGLDFSSIFPVFRRTTATILLSAIGLVFIFLGTLVWNVENTVSAFVSLFGVLAAPWITISLVGHVSHRGYYSPEDLQVFNRRQRGGIYWYTHGLNLRAVLGWLLGSGVGLLFLSTSLYVGPWSDAANGVDLSWLSAGVVGAVLYTVAVLLVPEPPSVSGRSPAAAVPADKIPAATRETAPPTGR